MKTKYNKKVIKDIPKISTLVWLTKSEKTKEKFKKLAKV